MLGLAANVSAEEDRITSVDWVYKRVEGNAVIPDDNGTDATYVSPASICNRAQMVAFLYSAIRLTGSGLG